MNNKPESRIDKIVSDLLRGRRLKLRGGDAEEKEAITTAARLAGARHGPQRMTPAFRKRLERALEHGSDAGLVTRRSALVAGLGLVAGAAGGGLLGRALAPEAVARSTGGEPIEPINARWIDVAGLSDLADGIGKRVSAGAIRAYVFRRGDTVTGVSGVCSHLPCDLWWNASGGVLECPCHPASFLPDGRPSNKSYHLPALSTIHVRVTPGGRVEVLSAE